MVMPSIRYFKHEHLLIYAVNMCHVTTPIDPFRPERFYVSLNEKNETCHILVPNELKNAEFLTVQFTVKSIIHHGKHIGLRSVLHACTISEF